MNSLAQEAETTAEELEEGGHFLDQWVDNVTDLPRADQVFNWFGDVFAWIGENIVVFAIPIIALLVAVMGKKIGAAIASAVGLAIVLFYRFSYRSESTQADITADGRTPVSDNDVLDNYTIPVGDWVEQVTRWVDVNLGETLAVIKWPFQSMLDLVVNDWMTGMSWITLCAIIALLAWAIRNVRIAALSFIGLSICGLLGGEYWRETAFTIGFIAVIVFLCVLVGIPLGVLCGRVDGVWKVVRPVLDAMQVIHSFVYLLPFIFFFGIGNTTATMVSMVFALPPLVRLTNLGIRQVPEDVVEAARAYGAPEWRVLFDVQLPLARPAIMTGLNQNLLLAISMLGVAAIAGAGGLGRLLFRAISNLDIALASSAGLAFFIVAVVLDRLTQPEGGDGKNLFGRIAQAWANRANAEKALEESEAVAAAARAAKQIEKPKPVERWVPVLASERPAIIATALGGVVMLVSLLLTWTSGASLISSYGRRSDESFPGESFNGISASGGSWFGIIIAIAAIVVILSAVLTTAAPGRYSRWMGPDGAAIAGIASTIAVLLYLVASPPDQVTEHSHGAGVYLALVGAIIAAAGAIWWTWIAPQTAARPLQASVGWGRVFVSAFAVLVMVIAAYSGWTYDTRADSVITPELQAEIDAIQAEARIAEDEGDLARAGTLAAEMTAIISKAQRTGDVVFDGFTDRGAGLGWPVILLSLFGVAVTLPAVGLFGIDEHKRYRWSSIASGIGMGLVFVGAGWVLTIARASGTATNFVSGIGSALVIAAGFFLFSHGIATQSEFVRSKIYGDDPAPASDAQQPTPAPEPEPAGV